ncbi:LIM zinc-binding domain-containing Nebulette isoform X2 [Hermetia illucens]|uniref:LIM zinc-binding domain-containing Nebulette isoform X2 n=1 Tax=Hermetia illucens TaxID=343691 RepID=UPI0018CBFFF4|nr:LIM zinc-binding domain-containing Nebulette isoform X2 [Hermetia illucens]
MNKTCARCSKVVYPIEELKCLDKIWHKTCFKCHECGMALNMKTYKGFNKLPYCEAHIPKAKATAIADTPELKRIAENTKIQSNVKYHEEFEKQKGKVTQVADDPETLRIKQNTKIISNVAYHGELEKKAAMEKQRGTAEVVEARGMMQQPQSNQQIVHQQQQQMQSYQKQTQQQPIRQSAAATSQQPNYASQPQQQQQTAYQQQQHVQQQQNNYMQMRSSILQNAHHPSGGEVARDASAKYYDQYENYARPTSNAQISQNSYNNNNPSVYNNAQPNYMYQGNNSAHYNPSTNGGGSNGSVLSGIGVMGGNSGIGKIADYDPLTDGPRSIPSTPRQSATLIYSSDRGAVNNSTNPRRVGSIADIDPANGVYGSITEPNNQNQYYQQQNQIRQGHQHSHIHQTQQQQQQQPQQNHQSKANMRVYRALYDYQAQDMDEVSFKEGDLIFEIDPIDAGWMTGKVERTGKTGMLPANYLQPAMI